MMILAVNHNGIYPSINKQSIVVNQNHYASINRGVLSKGGCFLSCLYPPLTRKIMKKNKRNYKVDFFRYNGDDIELWKSVYFVHVPSLQWLMSELTSFYDSFTVSKLK